MNAVLPIAESMLRQHGEFYPYAAYMKADRSIVHVAAADHDTDHPKPRDLLYVLEDSLRQLARNSECIAVALVWDVTVDLPETAVPGDAIQLCLEHLDGYSVEVFFPYRIAEGSVVFGESFANRRVPAVFGME